MLTARDPLLAQLLEARVDMAEEHAADDREDLADAIYERIAQMF